MSCAATVVIGILSLPGVVSNLCGQMDFRLLGPLEVQRDAAAPLSPVGKPGALLAALLFNANRPVPAPRLIEALWDGAPPQTADNLVQGYVSRLRKEVVGVDRIDRVGGAYRLAVDDDELDASRFTQLLEEGTDALDEGESGRAAAVLRRALALWRGDVMSGLDVGHALAPEARRLEELRVCALEARIDADLACGRHTEVVPELEVLTSRHPLREGLWRQLMIALYRSGRQSEALERYRRARGLLLEELALEPGEALRELERSILCHDASLREATTVGAGRPGRTRLVVEVARALGFDGTILIVLEEPAAPSDRPDEL